MDHNDNITFSISQVANMLGVVPGTIRNWEKAGLITVKRSDSNYRIFTVDDLATLRRVKEYSIDKHMGAHAIKLLLGGGQGAGDFEASIRQQAEKQYSKKLTSEKWRELRKQKGYTLEDVSRQVGISVAHLSKLENGGNVSLELLRDLLEPVRDEKHLVEKDGGDPLDLNGDPGIGMLSLVAMREHVMYPVLCEVQPGSGNKTPHTHNGEEFIYMFSGTLELQLNDDPPYTLRAGDSFYYRGSDLHSWWNPSRRKAKFLWVHSSAAK